MNLEDILTSGKWGKPREIQTKYGPRVVRKSPDTEALRRIWRDQKDAAKTIGLSFGEYNGKWEFTLWQKIDIAEQARRSESVDASRATAADIELPVPDGLEYMPFQKAGIRYAISRPNTLFSDEMGLGKTIQAIGVINADATIKSVIVVCPASLKINWRRELEKWLTRKFSIGIANGGAFPASDVVILNYDILKKHSAAIAARTWDMCIMDEAHYIKNPKAQRSKLARAIKADRILRLTGTPIVNRPIELFNLISDMHDGFKDFWPFAKRYAGAFQNGYGLDLSGATNLDELQRRLRETIMVRRLKKDVLTELPPKRRQLVEITSDNGAVKAEKSAVAGLEAALESARVRVEMAKTCDNDQEYEAAVAALRDAGLTSFTEISRIRHDTALAKVPAVVEFLTETLEQVDKVVVFAHHHDVIDMIFQAANDKCMCPVRVTGSDNIANRQKSVDEFQNNPDCRIFIGNIQAAGVGITLTSASTVVFAELDWVPGNMSQAEDRCHRIGQHDNVSVYHVVLNDSIDAQMARTLIDKQAVIDAALDTIHRDRVYESAPILPVTAAATENASRKQIEKEAAELTPEQITEIHGRLRILAGLDADHCTEKNDVGFNRVDNRIGHELAEISCLTPKQAALAARILKKYWRQTGR